VLTVEVVVLAGVELLVVGPTEVDVEDEDEDDVVVSKVIWLPPTATTPPVRAFVASGIRNAG
jgi:hypothetical protein